MKKHIQIKNSYKIWSPSKMITLITAESPHRRKYGLLIIEWWIHNVGYWITKPFTFVPAIKRLNLRFKDVDLMVREDTK